MYIRIQIGKGKGKHCKPIGTLVHCTVHKVLDERRKSTGLTSFDYCCSLTIQSQAEVVLDQAPLPCFRFRPLKSESDVALWHLKTGWTELQIFLPGETFDTYVFQLWMYLFACTFALRKLYDSTFNCINKITVKTAENHGSENYMQLGHFPQQKPALEKTQADCWVWGHPLLGSRYTGNGISLGNSH